MPGAGVVHPITMLHPSREAPQSTTAAVVKGRLLFSCSGRIINSFALIYPVESKREFDPIVAGIEKTFRPGQNCGGFAAR